MTPQEQELIMSMALGPGRDRAVSPDEVLQHFGTSDGKALGLSLLRDAIRRHDADDVEMALIVAATFGVSEDYLDPLIQLTNWEWHHKHEDVVSLLGQLHSPEAVDALEWMARWVPGYLDFDESRALATKALWALGGTPGAQAEQALIRLLDSDSEIVRDGARAQLARRQRG